MSSFYLQKVGSFQHMVNVSSIQWQLSTVQEVHYSIQTDERHPNQLHLQTERGQWRLIRSGHMIMSVHTIQGGVISMTLLLIRYMYVN